jgi:hypothetical protein
MDDRSRHPAFNVLYLGCSRYQTSSVVWDLRIVIDMSLTEFRKCERQRVQLPTVQVSHQQHSSHFPE